MSGQPTVLHVDDDSSMLEYSREMFGELSPETTVLTRDDPTEALATLASEPVDVLISDSVTLEDGRSFVVAVRNEYPDLPIVLYTAKDNTEVAGPLANGGITQYAHKDGVPFETVVERMSSLVTGFADGGTETVGDSPPEVPAPETEHVETLSPDDGWLELGRCDPTGIDELLTTLVAVVGDRASDEPIGDSVDLESVAAFFASTGRGRIHFAYGGYEIAVTSDGVVAGRPLTRE